MERLRVSFGAPVHGWMPFALKCAGGAAEFVFSDVPRDSLGDLAEQLRAVVDDGLSRTVGFCLEPAEVEFRLESLGQGRTRLTVTRWSSAARTTGGDVMLVWEGAASDLALGHWRAFRHLQADHFVDGTSSHWRWPFPAKHVELLGRSLGRST